MLDRISTFHASQINNIIIIKRIKRQHSHITFPHIFGCYSRFNCCNINFSFFILQLPENGKRIYEQNKTNSEWIDCSTNRLLHLLMHLHCFHHQPSKLMLDGVAKSLHICKCPTKKFTIKWKKMFYFTATNGWWVKKHTCITVVNVSLLIASRGMNSNTLYGGITYGCEWSFQVVYFVYFTLHAHTHMRNIVIK